MNRVPVKRFASNEGFRTALVASVGRKWTQLVVVEADGLRIKRVPNSDARFLSDLPNSTKSVWQRMARKAGTTKSARRAVKEILSNV